ncbi:hypothetical protein IEQ44_14250 [Nocardioides sp. Y6]|uniref:LapA family protein n=1 Tax=Nocardioides malaquae TaxID=2773426 RepID=A0ABR9RW36_9ACTN|nr:hypothetical protein [Nocardioides malaquae]MBE7325810.1 hypothetical protein [Nocardioides malaquae]
MGKDEGTDPQTARTPRRATPVASVVMVLVGGLVWFFLHNLSPLHPVVSVLVAAAVGLVVGFVAQEVAARRRR